MKYQVQYRWLSLCAEVAFLWIAACIENAWNEKHNMLVDFMSDTPWEAFICSHRNQNGGASQWNCARNSVGLRGSFYRRCG
jgi:hypothetical protein